MAADRRRPQQLVERGLASAEFQQTYAVGVLGLWWPGGSGTTALDALAALDPRSVCMANPAFAPYGEAAWAMLQSAGLEASWLEGVVRVDNVNLVAGLIAQGHARAGFVARSSLIAGKRRGTVVVADEEVLWFAEQAPIEQAMVLLARAERNVAAQHWVQQMQTEPIRALIRVDGYRLPGKQN
jgi:molybdate transport system substrate-binding protein